MYWGDVIGGGVSSSSNTFFRIENWGEKVFYRREYFSHIYSHRMMVFIIWLILSKAEKKVKFFRVNPLTDTSPNWHFPKLALPKMALPLTGTSLNWYFPQLALPQLPLFANFLCHWEFKSPNCRYTKSIIYINFLRQF